MGQESESWFTRALVGWVAALITEGKETLIALPFVIAFAVAALVFDVSFMLLIVGATAVVLIVRGVAWMIKHVNGERTTDDT